MVHISPYFTYSEVNICGTKTGEPYLPATGNFFSTALHPKKSADSGIKKNNPHLKITKIAEGVRSEALVKSNFFCIIAGIVVAQLVSYDSCRRPRGGFLCGGRRIENKKTFLPRRASERP
jgi:hypothetical protein